MRSRLWVSLASALFALACTKEAPVGPPEPPASQPAATDEEDLVSRLRAFEDQERARTKFDKLPPWSTTSGSDPVDIAMFDGELHVFWRGDHAVTSGDSRFEVPSDIEAMSLDNGGLLLVGGDAFVVRDPDVTRTYRVERALSLSSAVRSANKDRFFLTDREASRLVVLHRSGEVLRRLPTCAAPDEVQRVQDALFVRCAKAHTVWRYPLESSLPGAVDFKIEHDGPIHAMVVDDDITYVAGLEDAPLDRTIGSFGQVDSFVFRYDKNGARIELNVGVHGVITPKLLTAHEGSLFVGGPGGRVILQLDAKTLAVERTHLIGHGVVGAHVTFEKITAVRPLFDDVVEVAGEKLSTVATGRSPEPEVVLGERLFFTSHLAPAQKSEGKLSRFTCETCHLGGTIDGRIHHTGRGDVRVSTKTLRGLFNNRPHFSRALDESLSRMVHNEFAVAHSNTGADPLGQDDPFAARKALARFLMTFTPELNPRTRGRTKFSALEKSGAALFETRCATCHEARLVVDQAQTEPPERWEVNIFNGGTITWARDTYEKTSVTPYVHEEGARVPSLRRASRKFPLLTTGEARDLSALLRLFGELNGAAHHRAPAGAQKLSATERRALRAFLEIL